MGMNRGKFSYADKDGNKPCAGCKRTLPVDNFPKRDKYERADGTLSEQRWRSNCFECSNALSRFNMKKKAAKDLEEFKNMEKLKIMKERKDGSMVAEELEKKDGHIKHLESEIKTLQEQLELTLSMVNKDARKMFLYMNPKLAKLNFKEQFRPFTVTNVALGEDIGVYSNKVLVSEELGVPMHKLEAVLKGYQVTANGFHFEYVTEGEDEKL